MVDVESAQPLSKWRWATITMHNCQDDFLLSDRLISTLVAGDSIFPKVASALLADGVPA